MSRRHSSGVAKPTVSGRLTVVAPAAMQALTTSARKSVSVRLASIGENSTSSHRLRASAVIVVARCSTSDADMRSWPSRWIGEVPMNTWMRERCAGASAPAQARTSSSKQRLRPAMTGPSTCSAMARTAAWSPGELNGKPASMMSTPVRASC